MKGPIAKFPYKRESICAWASLDLPFSRPPRKRIWGSRADRRRKWNVCFIVRTRSSLDSNVLWNTARLYIKSSLTRSPINLTQRNSSCYSPMWRKRTFFSAKSSMHWSRSFPRPSTLYTYWTSLARSGLVCDSVPSSTWNVPTTMIGPTGYISADVIKKNVGPADLKEKIKIFVCGTMFLFIYLICSHTVCLLSRPSWPGRRCGRQEGWYETRWTWWYPQGTWVHRRPGTFLFSCKEQTTYLIPMDRSSNSKNLLTSRRSINIINTIYHWINPWLVSACIIYEAST